MYKLVCFFLILISCSNNQQYKITTDLVKNSQTAIENSDLVAMPSIQFEDEIFDFGKINQNESVSKDFYFKNTGDASLLIRSAKGSCGCTVPNWPRDPIEPGGEAILQVTFNSGNKKGKQNKIVTLVTNAIPSTKVLTIKGTVLVPVNN